MLSTTESEYIAATHAAKEALWLRSLITQLFKLDLAPTVLFCDNQSAIELTKDHQYHARTKHIDIRYHFIRWIVEQGSIPQGELSRNGSITIYDKVAQQVPLIGHDDE